MASGEKLPKTNLNLIQDTDMIDHADINAIAQAVEANTTKINAFHNSKTVPGNTSLDDVGPGIFYIRAIDTIINKPDGATWGQLLSWGTAGRTIQIFFGATKAYWRQQLDQSWTGWYEIGSVSV